MSVVAGTDFSSNARAAARVAAAIAKRLDVPLHLVHVFDEPGAERALAEHREARFEERRRALNTEAEELRRDLGVEVFERCEAGDAEQVLTRLARDLNAELLLVGSLGHDKALHWLVGSVAERCVQLARAPVLVVRDAARLEAWATGKGALRVLVGVERSAASRQALRLAARLRKVAPVDLDVVQVVWPLGEHLRLGVPAPIPADRLRPEIEAALVRELQAFVGELPGEGATHVSVSPSYARADAHLVALAHERGADLLLLGAHRRSGVARLWQGSVSRAALHDARCSVACVPADPRAVDEHDTVRFARVLAPTDFSPLAERAVSAAFGVVAPGGVVHLVHVVPKGALNQIGPARERLRLRAPPGSAERGVSCEVEVLEHDDPALAIAQAAARFGVDVICMATHGRTGLARAALGSQAEAVLRRAGVPVLLLPAEREGDAHGL